ncbi:hypothetical protein AGOR_G00091000 [Albula goreensis]|uniref:Uncharacterized protein n=1 Tax=Albula goreensis TaxID=1534307 RepID=A0A8T3DEZ1_9TELE|nr:hypothetical protein AGOR_G00091000 [Albula goreensis]
MPSLDLHITENRGVRSPVSPGLRYGNSGVSWGSSPQRQRPSAGALGRDPSFSSSPQVLRPRESVRLNKFPLDLESLVTKPPDAPMEPPFAPKPPPRSNSKLSSLSGIDPRPQRQRVSRPSLPGADPQLKLASQPQVVQLSPVSPTPPNQLGIFSSTEQAVTPEKESVGSILQRIASFSRPENPVPRPRENHHGNRAEQVMPPLQQKKFKKEEGKSYF